MHGGGALLDAALETPGRLPYTAAEPRPPTSRQWKQGDSMKTYKTRAAGAPALLLARVPAEALA